MFPLVSYLHCQPPPQFTGPSAELLQLFVKPFSEPSQSMEIIHFGGKKKKKKKKNQHRRKGYCFQSTWGITEHLKTMVQEQKAGKPFQSLTVGAAQLRCTQITADLESNSSRSSIHCGCGTFFIVNPNFVLFFTISGLPPRSTEL